MNSSRTSPVYSTVTVIARASDLDSRAFLKRAVFHDIKPAAYLHESATKKFVPLFNTDAIEAIGAGLAAHPEADLRHIGPEAIAKHMAPEGCDFGTLNA